MADLRELLTRLDDQDWRVAFRAEEQLVALGAAAAEVIAERVERNVGQPDTRYLRILVRIGPPAVSALLPLLNGYPAIRELAQDLLALIAPQGVRPHLGASLLSENPRSRSRAADLLFSGDDAPPAEFFQELLASKPHARPEVLKTLGDLLGRSGVAELVVALGSREEAVSLLLRGLRGEDEAIGRGALRGLLLLDPLPLREVQPLLFDADGPIRERAAMVMHQAGPAAVDMLIEALETAIPRERACPECGVPGPVDHPCCETCGAPQEPDDPAAQWTHTVALACGSLAAVGFPAVYPLCGVVDRNPGRGAVFATRLLGQLGYAEAIPCLVHALEGPLVIEAAHALAGIAQRVPDGRLARAIPLLKRQFGRSTRQNYACAVALSAIHGALGHVESYPVPAAGAELEPDQLPRPAEPQDPSGPLPRIRE